MVEISRTVLLTEDQSQCLEKELSEEPGAERKSPSEGDGHSQVFFYDNDGMALTLRGWWLSLSGAEDWLLRVPVYKPVPGDPNAICFVKHEELTGGEEILVRLGLPQHAELFKTGKQTNFERLLAQAGVQVCGVVHSKRVHFTMSGGGLGISTADKRSLSVLLESLQLDVKYAENQAVANLLFMMGNAARKALRPAVAKFTLRAEVSPSLDMSELRSDLANCLQIRNIADVIPAREVQSSIWAYLATLRPVHLQKLYKGSVFAQRNLELAEPQDDDILPPSAAEASNGYAAGTEAPVAAGVE